MGLERPDSGFAWVVAFCACVINTLLSGIARMVGILYVALIDEYGVTRQEASLPFIIRNAVRYLTGPLAGALGQTYGVRAVTFWGGVVASVGSILSAFAPDVNWIVFFWGCIHGLGFSLANTLFQHIINQWFERHRATASGLVLCGSCVGSIIYPIMLQAMIGGYGIGGCFLLLGGLFLNILPPALILKVPSWIEYPEAYARHKQRLSKSSPAVDIETRQKSEKPPNACWNTSASLDGPRQGIRPRVFTYFDDKKATGKLWSSAKEGEDECNRVVCTQYQFLDVSEFGKDSKFKNGVCNPAFIGDNNAPMPTSGPQHDCPKLGMASPSCGAKKRESNFLQNVKSIPRLYLNPVFDLISVSVATYFWMFLPLMTVVVDYTRDKGIPHHYEKFLIYALTFGDFFGRVSFGWVTDRKFLNLPSFMLLSFVFQGAVIALLPMTRTPTLCMVVLTLTGIPAGTIFVHFPVLIHHYVEEENQSIALGCIGLLSSIVSFGMPPVIGYFRDQVGSYDGLFYIIAIMSVANGLLWPLVSFCRGCHDPSQARRPTEYKDIFKDSPQAT